MIAFLLGLLKVIGITLLVILILLLVILGIVLFIPFRYYAVGVINEEKKAAEAGVTWLLKAVQCGIDYTFPEKPLIKVKIFGIDVIRLTEKHKSDDTKNTDKSKKGTKGTKKKKPKKQTAGINMSLLEEASEPETAAEVQNIQSGTSSKITFSEDTSSKEAAKEKINEVDAKDNSKGSSGKSPKEKVPLKEKQQSIIDKVKNIIYNIQYYLEILQEEETKQLITNARGVILRIIKSIRPREFRLEGQFGFETPDTTGKIYGMYAVVMPIIGEYVILVPDFEKQILQGNIALKGRITVYIIVKNALQILFDKRLQPLIRKLKHGGNKNGRE